MTGQPKPAKDFVQLSMCGDCTVILHIDATQCDNCNSTDIVDVFIPRDEAVRIEHKAGLTYAEPSA